MFSGNNRLEKVPLFLFLLVFSAFGFAVDGNAQDREDSVQLGASYQYQSFYQLSFGERKQVSIQSWDLAFDVRAFGYTVRINDGAGAELYRYPYGDTGAWNSIDTAGIATWSPLYNSDTSWSVDAFNRY